MATIDKLNQWHILAITYDGDTIKFYMGGKLIHNPDIISRGFVYLKENRELINQARNKIRKIVEDRNTEQIDADFLKNKIRNDIGQFLFSKTGKRPMVLPVVIEV